eukprot:CAMPEP_0170594844 /NCGR_PEP_ID=MMETSP0224-20130122/14221_1 /TAXON_ID=285029 /ORGANISM="Togula jolla, Strain CCCM 725" /LENGTH=63 /DNA_ID=CAMNT_0010918937 /DNA_START=47 /DNA_END=234 /DNA_ORIENTATION=+
MARGVSSSLLCLLAVAIGATYVLSQTAFMAPAPGLRAAHMREVQLREVKGSSGPSSSTFTAGA